jgi:hypothetical protein
MKSGITLHRIATLPSPIIPAICLKGRCAQFSNRLASRRNSFSISDKELLLRPFVFDTTFTILRRWRRGENIFAAHRPHRYQRLLITGWRHRTVTLLYLALALLDVGLALTWVAGLRIHLERFSLQHMQSHSRTSLCHPQPAPCCRQRRRP